MLCSPRCHTEESSSKMRSQRCYATNADHSEGVCAFESGRAQNGTRLECALLRQLGGDVQRANDLGQQQYQQQPPPHVGQHGARPSAAPTTCASDPFSEPVAVLHTRPLVCARLDPVRCAGTPGDTGRGGVGCVRTCWVCLCEEDRHPRVRTARHPEECAA
jgi:hypothetical protein